MKSTYAKLHDVGSIEDVEVEALVPCWVEVAGDGLGLEHRVVNSERHERI